MTLDTGLFICINTLYGNLDSDGLNNKKLELALLSTRSYTIDYDDAIPTQV
jgi:hypothetical protein